MPTNTPDPRSNFDSSLSVLAEAIKALFPGGEISDSQLRTFIRDALGTERFANNLSELVRRSAADVAKALSQVGITVAKKTAAPSASTGDASWIAAPRQPGPMFGVTLRAASPSFGEPFTGSADKAALLDQEWNAFVERVSAPDPFLTLYRIGVREYFAKYQREESPVIHRFIQDHFKGRPPQYVITVGIGANEQFWYYLKQWYDRTRSGGPAWIICDNPKDLAKFPRESNVTNTLFMEFSRSGTTQETVKVHEFLPRNAVRI